MTEHTECECGRVYGGKCHLTHARSGLALMVAWVPASKWSHLISCPEDAAHVEYLIVAPRCYYRLLSTEGARIQLLPSETVEAVLGVPRE